MFNKILSAIVVIALAIAAWFFAVPAAAAYVQSANQAPAYVVVGDITTTDYYQAVNAVVLMTEGPDAGHLLVLSVSAHDAAVGLTADELRVFTRHSVDGGLHASFGTKGKALMQHAALVSNTNVYGGGIAVCASGRDCSQDSEISEYLAQRAAAKQAVGL